MEPVIVRVGKRGVTEGLLRELDNVLRARGIVKVKLLKNFREAYGIDSATKRGFAEDLASKLGAKLVDVRGYTVVLRRGGGRG